MKAEAGTDSLLDRTANIWDDSDDPLTADVTDVTKEEEEEDRGLGERM